MSWRGSTKPATVQISGSSPLLRISLPPSTKIPYSRSYGGNSPGRKETARQKSAMSAVSSARTRVDVSASMVILRLLACACANGTRGSTQREGSMSTSLRSQVRISFREVHPGGDGEPALGRRADDLPDEPHAEPLADPP